MHSPLTCAGERGEEGKRGRGEGSGSELKSELGAEITMFSGAACARICWATGNFDAEIKPESTLSRLKIPDPCLILSPRNPAAPHAGLDHLYGDRHPPKVQAFFCLRYSNIRQDSKANKMRACQFRLSVYSVVFLQNRGTCCHLPTRKRLGINHNQIGLSFLVWFALSV